MCMAGLSLSAGVMAQGNVGLTGSVVDEAGAPVPFANVMLLDADSALVSGEITDEKGCFHVEPSPDAALLKISFIGYRDTVMPIATSRFPAVIPLREATMALDEVVVKGDRPLTRLKGDALVTSVENTLQSEVGSANDVLERVPGIVQRDQTLEVLGKGEPIVYLNGRQVRDLSELEQISSEDIKSVELVMNPGARYDATVKAVVRIRTTRRKGEGFGVRLRSSYYQSWNTDLVEQADLTYRRGALDLFGTLNYYHSESFADMHLRQDNEAADALWTQENLSWKDFTFDRLRATFGFNYMIHEDHSVGVKYDLQAYPKDETSTSTLSDVSLNGAYYDHLESEESRYEDYTPSHRLNAYYNGKAGNLSIDLNADYFYEKQTSNSTVRENSESQDNRDVPSINPVKNQLAAAKLILSLPLGGGELAWGGEYTYTRRTDDYLSGSEQYVPTSLSEIREDNASLFAEYDRSLPFGQFSAGLRYEHVKFDYFEDHQRVPEQSRKYDNIFPNLSLAAELGPIQAQVSYTAKTQRPSYENLSNNVYYLNRFTLRQGDPTLKHSLTHDVTLAGTWRFLQLMVSFQQQRDALIGWGMPQEGHPEVTVIQPINFDKLPQLSAFLSASPKIGIWSPSYTLGVTRQWMEITSQDRLYRMNRPVWNGTFNNAFALPWGVTFSANLAYTSKGNIQNMYLNRHEFVCDVSLRKSFLDDAFSVELRGSDLFHQNWNGVTVYFDRFVGWERDKYDTREFALTVRYKFNASKSRYKGTGAGQDALNRL